MSDRFLAALKARIGAGAAGKAQVENVTDIAIILDCSLSMLEKIGDQTKFSVATEAVKNLIAAIGDERRVAFIVYGHLPGDARKCAVEVKRRIGGINAQGKAELVRIIDSLVPQGNTPIADSLSAAGRELAKNPQGIHALILVTDGMETCGGKPEEVAARLAKELRLKKGVTVIGLGLKDDEKAAVERIAAAGKGKYYDGQKPEEVAAAFTEIKKEVVQQRAAPVEAEVQERAVRIVKPVIKELQGLKHLYVCKAGTFSNITSKGADGATAQYGRKIRLDAGQKVDIYWVGKDGNHVPLLKGFSIQEEKLVEVKPEDYLGIIRIDGSGFPKTKQIRVWPAGSRPYLGYLQANKYGVDIVVAAGRYDVEVLRAEDNQDETIASKITVKAGTVKVIKND